MINVTVEDLTEWIPKFLPFPRIFILRIYPDGIEPVEPNKFKFAVVAVIKNKTAEIKGLCNGLDISCFNAMKLKLMHNGIYKMIWRHNEKNMEVIFKE